MFMAKEEKKEENEEAVILILRLLNRRFGELDSNLVEPIQALGVSELEMLAEALLDFSTVADLER
ncbi:MAG: DUF4351 domain-containing protein [Cyanobacteria bacterium]|jgi:ABC-type methionine transport system permease subunit|nr:DUF4351 domain-containing protein [Cyanobacteria bacterium GSL.Bin1]